MKITEMFVAQLEREIRSTRRCLEQVPEGNEDWKPHDKSMPLGYLASLVAAMPSWISMMIDDDELDLESGKGKQPSASSSRDLIRILDESVAKARAALERTSDDHLYTTWKLKFGDQVLDDRPRHLQIADTFMHWSHHRGQLTVYLRLNDRPVPSIYGPSADESW